MTDDGRQRLIAVAAIVIGLALIGYFVLVGSGDESGQDAAIRPGPEDQETVLDALEPVRPAFDLVRISRTGTGVIAGRMTAGSDVRLVANGSDIASVTADQNGEWVIILNEPLEPGSIELNLLATAQNGLTLEADDVVVISVPERETESFIERAESGVVAVLSPKTGEGASRVLQKPGGAAFADVGDSLRVDTLDYGNGQPVVTGQALPRVQVRLYLDDSFIGAVKVDDDGRWVIPLNAPLSPGSHVLRVDQTLTGDDVQLRILQPFETGEPLDPSNAESGVLVQPGNTLWQIARRLYGSGVRYTLIFRENSEQIDDPDKIYPGQVFKLPED